MSKNIYANHNTKIKWDQIALYQKSEIIMVNVCSWALLLMDVIKHYGMDSAIFSLKCNKKLDTTGSAFSRCLTKLFAGVKRRRF